MKINNLIYSLIIGMLSISSLSAKEADHQQEPRISSKAEEQVEETSKETEEKIQIISSEDDAIHPLSSQLERELEAKRSVIFAALQALPHNIQLALLTGLELNINTLTIFKLMGRDKDYLFDPETKKLKQFFDNNEDFKYTKLSECPKEDFDNIDAGEIIKIFQAHNVEDN